MAFDTRDIRPGMDVYTYDGVYLGTVRRVKRQAAGSRVVPYEAPATMSIVTGELLGPMPTSPLGNPGPTTQSPRYAFGTLPDEAAPLGTGTFWVGKLPVPIGWRRFSLADVLTVSLERVVLTRRARELGVH